jgi:hypothetical protein
VLGRKHRNRINEAPRRVSHSVASVSKAASESAAGVKDRVTGGLTDLRDTVADRLPDVEMHRGRPKKRSRLLPRLAKFGVIAIPLTGALVYKLATRRNEPSIDPNRHSQLDLWRRGHQQETTTMEETPRERMMESPAASPEPWQSFTGEPQAPAIVFASLIGKDALDIENDKVGTIEGVYYREGTEEPEWVVLSTGLIEPKVVLAPLEGSVIGEEVRLAYPRALIADAPRIDADTLDTGYELLLYGHYGARRTMPPETQPGGETPLVRWPVREVEAGATTDQPIL